MSDLIEGVDYVRVRIEHDPLPDDVRMRCREIRQRVQITNHKPKKGVKREYIIMRALNEMDQLGFEDFPHAIRKWVRDICPIMPHPRNPTVREMLDSEEDWAVHRMVNKEPTFDDLMQVVLSPRR